MAIANADWWQWCQDCCRWRGEFLHGEYAHWCMEWDGLPVDETTREFLACSCYCDKDGCTTCTPEDRARLAAAKAKCQAEDDAFWAEHERKKAEEQAGKAEYLLEER